MGDGPALRPHALALPTSCPGPHAPNPPARPPQLWVQEHSGNDCGADVGGLGVPGRGAGGGGARGSGCELAGGPQRCCGYAAKRPRPAMRRTHPTHHPTHHLTWLPVPKNSAVSGNTISLRKSALKPHRRSSWGGAGGGQGQGLAARIQQRRHAPRHSHILHMHRCGYSNACCGCLHCTARPWPPGNRWRHPARPSPPLTALMGTKMKSGSRRCTQRSTRPKRAISGARRRTRALSLHGSSGKV